MSQDKALSIPNSTQVLAERVVADLASPHSRRAYTRQLNNFLAQLDGPITPEGIRRYLDARKAAGMGKRETNQALYAIKKLAKKAQQAGKLDMSIWYEIDSMRGEKIASVKYGNRLSLEQVQTLLDTPDKATLMGKRDRALMGVMLGAGLRRTEASLLEFKHLTQIAGHWRIVDVPAKHGKYVNAKLASWAKQLIDSWAKSAGIRKGRIFLAMGKHGTLLKERRGIDARTIYQIVTKYAPEGIAPHDLRRSFATLARYGGAPLEGIKTDLGHEDLSTTDKYIGDMPDSAPPSGDFIMVELAH